MAKLQNYINDECYHFLHLQPLLRCLLTPYYRLFEGLDHCITAPITRRDSLTDMNEFRYSRSMTEKKSIPRHDLKLDRLSDREKVYNKNLMHVTSFSAPAYSRA